MMRDGGLSGQGQPTNPPFRTYGGGLSPKTVPHFNTPARQRAESTRKKVKKLGTPGGPPAAPTLGVKGVFDASKNVFGGQRSNPQEPVRRRQLDAINRIKLGDGYTGMEYTGIDAHRATSNRFDYFIDAHTDPGPRKRLPVSGDVGQMQVTYNNRNPHTKPTRLVEPDTADKAYVHWLGTNPAFRNTRVAEAMMARFAKVHPDRVKQAGVGQDFHSVKLARVTPKLAERHGIKLDGTLYGHKYDPSKLTRDDDVGTPTDIKHPWHAYTDLPPDHPHAAPEEPLQDEQIPWEALEHPFDVDGGSTSMFDEDGNYQSPYMSTAAPKGRHSTSTPGAFSDLLDQLMPKGPAIQTPLGPRMGNTTDVDQMRFALKRAQIMVKTIQDERPGGSTDQNQLDFIHRGRNTQDMVGAAGGNYPNQPPAPFNGSVPTFSSGKGYPGPERDANGITSYGDHGPFAGVDELGRNKVFPTYAAALRAAQEAKQNRAAYRSAKGVGHFTTRSRADLGLFG